MKAFNSNCMRRLIPFEIRAHRCRFAPTIKLQSSFFSDALYLSSALLYLLNGFLLFRQVLCLYKVLVGMPVLIVVLKV